MLYPNSSLLHGTNMKGNTALHIAARLGHLEMIRLLLNMVKERELEVDRSLVRMTNLKGDTALHEAVRNGHYEVSMLLIDEDRDLTCFVNNVGDSPLFLAVVLFMYLTLQGNQSKSTNKQTLPLLWNKRSYIIQFTSSHFKFLLPKHGLAITGADFVGKVLKKCPSSMVEADELGWIPLHCAAHLGNVEVVELFLEINHSSIVYIKDKQGMSALHILAKEGHVDVMKSIITKCPDTCELLDDKDRTALHVAVETALQGHAKILEMLARDPRTDKGALNKAGMTTVDIIRSRNQLWELEIVKLRCIEDKGSSTEFGKEGDKSDFRCTETENLYSHLQQPSQCPADTMRKKAFKMFLLFDSPAVGCSAASMFVHFLAAAWPRRLCFTYPTYCVTVLTELSFVGIALASVHGSLAVFPDNLGLANLATNSVLLSFSIPILYFCLKIGYNACYLFKGHGLFPEKGVLQERVKT
ncbi:hypothetical protein TIFTF001_000996 [Ficus carica]|uniref:Uncharacterized protein n=1 Tax=Ficus carica TaxID=3494 RepID=A0AA87Z6S4_FICCA|nr:hypothetical protein TIFTF001_000996 [Ficus carica]